MDQIVQRIPSSQEEEQKLVGDLQEKVRILIDENYALIKRLSEREQEIDELRQ